MIVKSIHKIDYKDKHQWNMGEDHGEAKKRRGTLYTLNINTLQIKSNIY